MLIIDEEKGNELVITGSEQNTMMKHYRACINVAYSRKDIFILSVHIHNCLNA